MYLSSDFSITFETKCYENDWEFILTGHYLEKMIERCGINFTHKQLIINNVKNRNLVESYVLKKMQLGVIDSYHFTEDTEKEVLDFFHTPKESFGKGLVYSISELTGIYFCKTDYLLHFSSDAFLCRNATKSNWIEESIKIMNTRKNIIAAVPLWNHLKNDAAAESYGNIGDFYLCQGISDQCYLVPMKVFKGNIYNTKHPYSERYPEYGGELFEKRIDAYMRNNDFYRIVYKKSSYIHGNFPKKIENKKKYLFITKKIGWEFTPFYRTPSFVKRIYDVLKSYYKTVFKKYKNMSHKQLNEAL